eukprot:11685128-Karenia_brevis.AAC.1
MSEDVPFQQDSSVCKRVRSRIISDAQASSSTANMSMSKGRKPSAQSTCSSADTGRRTGNATTLSATIKVEIPEEARDVTKQD